MERNDSAKRQSHIDTRIDRLSGNPEWGGRKVELEAKWHKIHYEIYSQLCFDEHVLVRWWFVSWSVLSPKNLAMFEKIASEKYGLEW
jgi:hypothetical protein